MRPYLPRRSQLTRPVRTSGQQAASKIDARPLRKHREVTQHRLQNSKPYLCCNWF